MNILTHSTVEALWHDVIHTAQSSCDISLREELESYLVFLLMRYINQSDWVKQAVAIDFMEGMNMKAGQTERKLFLQRVGDKCLLLAGLYPGVAEKRLVKVSYFVKLGQASYVRISEKRNDLYASLSRQFVSLMDILQSVRQYSREYPDLLPLQAYELWNDTGSKRALSALRQYTQSVPLLIK